MQISLIVAMGESRQIGLKGRIPWHLPSDLKNFKKITMDHTLILGRKTFESIGKALPGRKMIILTQNKDFKEPDCLLAQNLEQALELAKKSGETEVFIAGGAEVYKSALSYVNKLYLSWVDYDGEADVYFPVFSIGRGWTCEQSVRHLKTENEPAWVYEVWIKIQSNNLENHRLRSR